MKLLSNLISSFAFTLLMPPAFAGDAQSEYSYILKNGVQVTLIEEPFNTSRHKVTLCHERTDTGAITNITYVCKIDGLPFYGVGESPEPDTELTTIKVTIRGHLYRLNTSQMYNAWRGFRDPNDSLWVTCHKKFCSVKGVFSDATGTFVAEWSIQNGKSKRILISGDELIVMQFIDKKRITNHSSGAPNRPLIQTLGSPNL